MFQPLGGNADQVLHGGGMDLVEFGAETTNGKTEITQTFRFSSDDTLDLGGATVESLRNGGQFADLTLSGDGDRIVVFGVHYGDLSFV